jgi:hypothetical protein
MTELRKDVIQSGHRRRGSGIGLSLEDLEIATQHDRQRDNVWYVDSNASAGGSGRSWVRAFLTIQEAAAAALADDYILVAPAHVETVTAAAGLELNTAGVTLLGYGNGDRCPQIDFTTVVGADMNVGAAGVTMVNFRFTGGIDALTGPIDVNAADFTLLDCVTQDVTGQAVDFIVTDANADRMSLIRWTHRGALADGPQTAISIVGGDQITIEDPFIDGHFSVAAIENVTTAATNLRIYGGQNRPGYIRVRDTTPNDVCVTLVSSTTADIGPFLYGRIVTAGATVTEAFVGAAARFWQPVLVMNESGRRGLETNITASAG